MNQAYREFEFDLPGALLVRLIDVLAELETAPLTREGLEGVPDAQGVYQLFHQGNLVYIGKTDAEAGLRHRLNRHAVKILSRRGLAPEDVTYKAVRIFVFTAVDLETQLIKHFAGTSGTVWNNSGFGANDPGRRRDHTRIKATNFDARFPIDLDQTLDVDFSRHTTAATALQALKANLNYLLRFESNGRKPHDDLIDAPVAFSAEPQTPRGVLRAVVAALPPGWQATALPSHILFYKERDDTYPDAEIIGRS